MMKKIYFLISVFCAIGSALAADYLPLTDSVFTYLQGDWYQSYKVINGGNICANGVKKHAGLPSVKITYKKLDAQKGLIIRETGKRFHSVQLNHQFNYDDQPIKDTIFLQYYSILDRWQISENQPFNGFIDVSNKNNHIMWFYEYELVGFERDPYWSLATYLIKNNWAGTHCQISNGQMSCLTMVYFTSFTLKNDTLTDLGGAGNANVKFVYNYDHHSFEQIGNPNIKISLSSKDSSVVVTDGSSFVSTYRKSIQSSIQDNTDFRGNWNGVGNNSDLLSFEDKNDTLWNCTISQQHCYQDFSAVAKLNMSKIGSGNPYLEVVWSHGCVPTLSRFELINNKTELKNITTGQVYSRVTSIDDSRLQDRLTLKTNPISDGNLEVLSLGQFKYSIYTTTGILVKSGMHSGGPIDVTMCSTGCYILNVQTDQGLFVTKFLIN